jgi:glutamate decarboxylase
MTNIADKSELTPLFARPGESAPRDLYSLGYERMLPDTAYQLVHDEAMLDGNARLNLATFVGTFMDEHANKLYSEAFDKNMIDKDEYRATAAIEDRCWKILAELWHAPSPESTIGTSTIGSSEACMLGGLALKRLWQQRRKLEGKSIACPNLVMSSAVQVCWEKFANYWDVEPRYVPITEEHKTLCGHSLAKYVDENTIGVVAVMGVTYTGMYEPVEEIAKALDAIEKETGLDVPIHIDAASGGFITPFLQPELNWDFKIERVHSISVSGHKYGLVYPGLGWVVWREAQYLPDDLIFKVSYLGGEMPTFALNFSRPGAQVLLQYYNFLRLGRVGLHPGAARLTRRGAPPRDDNWRNGAVRTVERRARTSRSSRGASRRATPRTGTSSTSAINCAKAAGWCPPTRCPTTSPTSLCNALSCATAFR